MLLMRPPGTGGNWNQCCVTLIRNGALYGLSKHPIRANLFACYYYEEVLFAFTLL